MVIEEGMKAPDFKLLDDANQERKLSDFLGKTVVLYFYPKDDTPGCTTEACSIRDDYSEFENAGVVILGVSPDSPKSHAKFKAKYNLPFSLLADEEHQVCEMYGVWGRKKYMGREYDGVFRTTFLIDPKGKIQKIFKDVKPQGHSKEILGSI